jgi:hypothetical protein
MFAIHRLTETRRETCQVLKLLYVESCAVVYLFKKSGFATYMIKSISLGLSE